MSPGLARGILNAIPPSIVGWLIIIAVLTAVCHALARVLT